LLAVHRSYQQSVHPLLNSSISKYVHGLSHITGGGIEGNTMRVIPNGLELNVDWNAWERPAIFNLIQHVGECRKKICDAHQSWCRIDIACGPQGH